MATSEISAAAELHRPSPYAGIKRMPLSETGGYDSESNLRVYVASPESANLQIRVSKGASVHIATAALYLEDAVALRDWLNAYLARRGA